MKLQKDNYSCGVYALLNASLCVGNKITKKNILKYSNTTMKNGTSEKGIINAARKNGLIAEEFNKSSLSAFLSLDRSLRDSKPVIIYLFSRDHWITVIGKLGSKYILFDPEAKKNNGILIYTIKELMPEWESNIDKKMYGIIISKRKHE